MRLQRYEKSLTLLIIHVVFLSTSHKNTIFTEKTVESGFEVAKADQVAYIACERAYFADEIGTLRREVGHMRVEDGEVFLYDLNK